MAKNETINKYESLIDDEKTLWNDSFIAFENDDYETAVFLLKKYIELVKDNPDTYDDLAFAYNNLAFAYNNLKEYSKAKMYLIMARKKFPEKNFGDVFYLNYAIAFAGLGDRSLNSSIAKKYYKQAMRYLSKCISINNKNTQAKNLQRNIREILSNL